MAIGTSLPLPIAQAILKDIESDIKANRYKNDPVAYAREVRNVVLTAKQESVFRALTTPPHRVMVKSANNCGKSFLAALACDWFYNTRDPSSTLLTAPTFAQVNDVTFKEVRKLMGDHPDLYPKAPRVQDHPGHLMNGFTAGSATAFQGRREASNFLVFEESTGIGPEFWTAARYMLSGGSESYWLSIHNPTDNSCHAYVEELSGAWVVISISAFEHPNILAELGGETPPIPAAVRLGQLKDNLDAEGQWVPESDLLPLDVDTWSPALYEVESLSPAQISGVQAHFPKRYWRPSPIGEARILGRYPTQSASSVFSEAAFNLSEKLSLLPDRADPIVIGCDVARFGDDDTTIHARRGNISLEHHTYHGQDTAQTAGRLKEMCKRLGHQYNHDPYLIRCNIDDSGVGGGVTDQRGEDEAPGKTARSYNFVPINNACVPAEADRFPNVRSEILFTLAERMNEGKVDLSVLDDDSRKTLRNQALQITYKLDSRGRRVVEQKADIKKRLGRSPDDLDGFALCYYTPAIVTTLGPGIAIGSEKKGLYANRGTVRYGQARATERE